VNTDIRVEVSFLRHRKRLKLRALLGPGSTDYLLNLWINTAMNHPSGELTGMSNLDVALEAGWEEDPHKFVSAMKEAVFLDGEEGSYCLHDWEEHQPWVVGAKARSDHGKKAITARWEKEKKSVSKPGEYPENTPSIPGVIPLSSPSLSLPTEPTKEKDSGTIVPVVTVGDGDHGEQPQQPTEQPVKPGNGKHPQPPDCPHQEIIAIYHEILPELPRVAKWTETRRKHLGCRWREDPERQNLDWWRNFFHGVRKCGHLMGHNERGWRADLPWMLKPEKFLGIIEGKYTTAHRLYSEKTARTIATLENVDLNEPLWGGRRQ